jgi:hypothetical protein
MEKKTKVVIVAAIVLFAVIFALGMTAQGASTQLTVQRTKMRDIAVQWTSGDGKSASCEVYQRIMFWQDYEYAMNFNIDSGDTFKINMDVLSPIYRDMKFVCVSGEQIVSVNTVFAMGALIINQIVPQSCPEAITTTTVPTTTTTTIPCPSCNVKGQACHAPEANCCNGLFCYTFGPWNSKCCKHTDIWDCALDII